MKKILLVLILGTFCLSANAHDEYYVPDVNPTFQINVYNEGETITDFDDNPITSTYTLTGNQREALLDGVKKWNDILNTSPNPNELPIFSISTMDDTNAASASMYIPIIDSEYLLTEINALINNKTPVGEYSDINGYAVIGTGIINNYPGWDYYTGPAPLHQKDYPSLYYTAVHELFHSIGLGSNADKYIPGDDTYYFSKDASSPISIWDSGLRIYANKMNKPFDADKIIAAEPGMSIRTDFWKNETFNLADYAPYFAGRETLKVLTGLDDTEENMQAYIFSKGGIKNYSGYVATDPWIGSKVLGLPVNSIEGSRPELSHIELRNGTMSHQNYRNWVTLMEAELAVLKDIGYKNVELRDYFGKSYYLDNITDTFSTGYGKWGGSGYNGYSTVTNGIGLHIYGNNNIITQNSNTLSSGKCAIGVRIDGTNNTYTLNNSLIDVKGDDSIGLAVTWGMGHTVNIDAGSTVNASGKNGIGVSFDFGKNRLGALGEDRGSYSNYDLSWQEDDTPDKDTRGALIENFNVEGTVSGTKAAIYTSENAYVKNINIKNGAEINGDIVSKWNSVKSGINMAVQRKGSDGWHPVDKDNPEEIYFTNLNFSGNSTINGNITGENDIKNTLDMKNTAGSTVNFNGEEINVNSLDNNGDINISKNAVIATVENSITGNGNLNVLSDASLGLSSNITNIENAVSLNSAALDMINGSIGATTFSNLTLSGNNSMKVDTDIASQTSDAVKFNAPSDLTVNPGASLNISVNMINANKTYTDDKYYIPFISSANNNQNLLGAVTLSHQPTVLTPIFKYNLGYTEDDTQGGFLFSRGATKDYGSYNPAVVASSVAAQFGGYLTQLNSYDEAFRNLDMKMLMTREERQAMKMANLYASTVTPTVYSPTYLPEQDKAAWFRPYASFEKVGLDNGPKVENISYGSYFGGDSPMFSTKNGWDYQYSVYAGYNGSHQNYAGNSIYQNGGTLGATAIWYKNDFFTALTANVGAGAAEASTMYGSEDFPMLMTGVASKTGYNWELAKGKFIIQPSYLMSYSFVNTFDYTNAAGVRIDSDPLHAINIAPGLKFIGNLKNGWQPYASVQMVWNIMDKTDFKANDVALPDMSVKPYVQYGVGIQKRWGERFTGFFQTMLRNGGRNGVALSLGFRWAIGK